MHMHVCDNGRGSQRELTLEKLIFTKQRAIVKFAKFICLEINLLRIMFVNVHLKKIDQ